MCHSRDYSVGKFLCIWSYNLPLQLTIPIGKHHSTRAVILRMEGAACDKENLVNDRNYSLRRRWFL